MLNLSIKIMFPLGYRLKKQLAKAGKISHLRKLNSSRSIFSMYF